MKKKFTLFIILNSIFLMFSYNVKAFSSDYINTTVFRDEGEIVQIFNNSKGNIYINSTDIDLMAKVVFGESRGEPYEGKVAVASVILNRVYTPGFPKSIREVILQPSAFSCVINNTVQGTPDESCYNAVLDALKGHDPTNNALFFYNPKISTCDWMSNINKSNIKSIGNHVFFIAK